MFAKEPAGTVWHKVLRVTDLRSGFTHASLCGDGYWPSTVRRNLPPNARICAKCDAQLAKLNEAAGKAEVQP